MAHKGSVASFPGSLESISAARNFISNFLSLHGRLKNEVDVNIAVGEVLQNIIRYGFDGGSLRGTFTVFLKLELSQILVTVIDTAPPSNAKAWSNTHRSPEDGGHGLSLVYALASDVEFTALKNGNKVKLEFIF
jgi:serine/threonine-protein kinase RsbW